MTMSFEVNTGQKVIRISDASTVRVGDCTVPSDFSRKRTASGGIMILVEDPAMLKVALIFGSILSL